MKISKYDEARFWSRVKVGDKNSCWYWDNPTHEFGYGWFGINGKNELSHRVAKIIWDGKDKDMLVLHSCDNPACCNPYHLRWGSQKDNIDDCIKRGRKTNPPRNGSMPPVSYGEDNPTSKMTWDKVKKLREEWPYNKNTEHLINKYNISRSTVYQIVNFKTWKYENLRKEPQKCL